MIVIITTAEQKRPYISGIFATEDAARKYLSIMPLRGANAHIVRPIEHNEYPLYITESDEGFDFYDAKALKKILKSMEGGFYEHNEGFICNVFTVTQDYEPATAGNDEMGKIEHIHLTEEDLGPRLNQTFKMITGK